MITPRSSTETLITALRVLARDIRSDDGVIDATLREVADRMEEMQRQLERADVKLSDGDLFWNDEGEEGYTDAFEALEGALDGFEGAFIERLQRSKRLRDVFVVGKLTDSAFQDVKFFATIEEAKVEYDKLNPQSSLAL